MKLLSRPASGGEPALAQTAHRAVEQAEEPAGPPFRASVLRVLLSLIAAGGILISAVVLLQPRPGAAAVPIDLPGAAPAPVKGRLAPDFTLALLMDSGTSLSLSDLRGKAVMLNFWATWCPPCRTEVPDLEAVWREHQAEGLVIVGVDLGEVRPAVTAFVRRVGVTYPVALDMQQQIGAAYGVSSLPATYFIDRQGIVRDLYTGGMTKRLMVSKLGQIL